MTLARIRKGDTVVVLTGKNRGKQGIVREVRPTEGRAIVQEVNVVKRRYKPGRGPRQAGGIVDLEQPIQLSNLAPVDAKTGRGTRLRTQTLTNGDKVRVATVSGEQIAKA